MPEVKEEEAVLDILSSSSVGIAFLKPTHLPLPPTRPAGPGLERWISSQLIPVRARIAPRAAVAAQHRALFLNRAR